MDQPPDKKQLFQQKQLLLQKQQQSQQQLQQSQQQNIQQLQQSPQLQVQQQQTYYQQQQVLQVQPQSQQQQQQQQLVTKQQLLRHNQQGILQQRILQQEHLKQQKLLIEHQQKQDQALIELLDEQDNNEDKPHEDRLLLQQQRPQLIQQQQQLHLQQQQRQQQEQQQQLQLFQQKQQQQPQQQTQIVVQQTQIVQSQQPQFVQQTIQTSQDVQQPLLVQKSQPQVVKKTQLVQKLAQQSQPVQFSQIVQQSQNVQHSQQNHQYTVSAQQTKQPPHSQQLLQQQLQQLLLNNKSLPQRIVVLGSQSQQQQLQQQPPRVVSANTSNQQHLLQQPVQCVVVKGTSQQQSQQRVVVTGNGHTQQQMQRIVVANTSQQQQQVQRVGTNSGQQQQQQQQQQQLQHVVLPSTIQQQSQQMQSIVTSSSTQQPQQLQRIVTQKIQHNVTSASSQQQQQLSQQSGQRIVFGQMKSLQQNQQVQSPSQCGVVVSQLQPKDAQHSIATKQQQQRVVISKQSQLLKLPQQQSPQQMLLTQQLTQQLLQPKQQILQQHVIAMNQQHTEEIDQHLQQQQQVSQNIPQSIVVSNRQPQQQIDIQSSDENLVQELHVKQSRQQLQQFFIQQSQEQFLPQQLNLQIQPQQEQNLIKNETLLENEKHEEIMSGDLIFGQLQHQLRPDPEKLKLQMQLQQLQRKKLQDHLLIHQRQQVQIQQEMKSKELKLQQKHHQQQLREQVLLQQHLKQQRQLQIRQKLLLRQQALSKNRISYVVQSKQEQNQQNDQDMINQQTKLPMPELLLLSENILDNSQQFKSDTKCHIKNSPINTEEQLISSSSSSDDEEDDDTTLKHRHLLVEAKRLVRERYDALSVALGPKYKAYYDEILRNWLHGRLSQVEFDCNIRKVMYVSWAVSITSIDKDINIVEEAPSTSKTSLDIANTSSKKSSTSTRSKSKQLAKSLSKNMVEKNKEIEMNNKKKEVIFVLEKLIPLHNAFIASLVEWMPLNSQRLDRRAARVQGVTETGCPLRLYTYADIPPACGPISHWSYEKPGSLTHWYWPDHLSCNALMINTNYEKSSSNLSFLAQEKNITADAAVSTVSFWPPSRNLLPLLLRSVENKEAFQATQRKWCMNMRLKKLELKSKKRLPRQWLKGKRQLALMVHMRKGHSQLLHVLKARNLELRSHERGLMERLNRLKTRVSLRRRKVLALFKIRQQDLKIRINKYFDRSWLELTKDQPMKELLKEAAIHIDDDDTNEDNEDNDEEGEEGQNIFLRKHWDRVRLLEEERGKQQQSLKVVNGNILQKQTSRGRRSPLTASTILLLRDRQKIRACRRLLNAVNTERFQVSRDVDRVLKLRHKLCPCGESDGRPCRYKSQMRRLLRKLKAHKLDEIGDQVQRNLVEEVLEKEKVIIEENKCLAKDTIKKEEIKVKTEEEAMSVTSAIKKKAKTAKKKKASKIEKNILSKKSKDLKKTVKSTNKKKTKTLKNAHKTTTKHLSMATKETTIETMVSPTLNDNKPVETVKKHDIGITCELLKDVSSPLTSLYSPAFQQSSLTTLSRRSTVDVAAAAARAVKAALAASRQTEHQEIADEPTISTDEEYADRQASKLMPPPPPPPPPLPTKTSITVKNPSVGARYLQQQQLLLDRQRQLERLRQEEKERRKQARLERRRLELENSDNIVEENNESSTSEMETHDLYFESLQQDQQNMHEGQSHDNDLEVEELNDNITTEEGRRRNINYFYYNNGDYYSSDEELSGSLLGDPFPPLLHDLRIDQLPRPSNRIPTAALLPPGVRTRFSSVPPIFSNHRDFESLDNNDIHKIEENQKPIESNSQKGSEEKQKMESNSPIIKLIDIQKKPSLPLPQNSFLTTSKKMEGITEPVTSSIIEKSPISEKRVSKKLQSKQSEQQNQQLSDGNLTVNKQQETCEHQQMKQTYKENEQIDMEITTLPSSPVARRNCRVSTKLSKTVEEFKEVPQELKNDVKLKLEIPKQKQNLNQVETPLIENKSTPKRESQQSNSQQVDKKKRKEDHILKKEPPLLKKQIIEVDLTCHNKIPMGSIADLSYVKPKKKSMISEQEHLIIPTNENIKNSELNNEKCKNPVLLSEQGKQLHFNVEHKKYKRTKIHKLIKKFGKLVFALPVDQQSLQMCQLKQILQLPVLSDIQNKSSQSTLETEVLHQLDVLLTGQEHHFLGEQKQKSSSLMSCPVKKKSKRKLKKRLRSLLTQIKKQWKCLHKITNIDKKDEGISTWLVNENKSNSEKDNKRLRLTNELVNHKNSNDSGCDNKSSHPLVKQKKRLGRYSRKRVERDKTQCQQKSVQKVSQIKRLKSQILNEQNTTNLEQKQINQHNRLARIKILEKEKLLLEQQKIQLDSQKKLEQMRQERKNWILERRREGRNNVEQERSKCLWTLVEFPLSSKSYYNERLSLREQLMRKVLMDKNVQQPLEVKQTQSKIATIGMVTKNTLEIKNKNKLEMKKTIHRGSCYWWNMVGMQWKTSPLLLSVNKPLNQKSQLNAIKYVPFNRKVQQIKPQTKKKAAVIIFNNYRKIEPTILSLDEQNKLQQFLRPQILKMLTEAEEKWVEQLQSQSVELDQQVSEQFKAMLEKQQQQVQLLLKNGKQLKEKYHPKYKLNTKLIVTHPLENVSKQWKQLEILRLKHQKQWKTKLAQLLKAKMANKLFFHELYDRFMKLLTSSVQNQLQPNILSALKQLRHKPLNANEQHELQKLMEPSNQKFMTQTSLKQVNKQQVIIHKNKSSQKQTQPQNNMSKKSRNQELPLKPKQVEDEIKQNKQPQEKQTKFKTQEQVNRGRIIAKKRPKPLLAMKLRRLFHLRNRLNNVQPKGKESQQRQSMSTTDIFSIKSKQQKRNKPTRVILRKMAFLLYTQRIVLQRQLDRLSKWYPDSNKCQDLFVLLTPQKITTLQNQTSVAPVQLHSLKPLSSEKMAKESTLGSNREQQQMAEEKRQILKQRLNGVLSQLKPLMGLWQLYLRFPERWLHQQLRNIEKISRKKLLAKSMVNTSSQTICLQKSLHRHDGEPAITTTDYKAQRWSQQIQRIWKHLNWRQQRVSELLVELSMAMRKGQHLILPTPASPQNSFYSVSLRLGKPSISKHMFSKYSALLRLRRSSALNNQNLSYALFLKLQQSFISKKISSNYSALLKLHKSSIRSALSTPQEPSWSKHQFSVSLTPLQPFNCNQNASNISAILNSLTKSTLKKQSSVSTSSSLIVNNKQLHFYNLNDNQLFHNKRQLSDGNPRKNYGDKIQSISTKKSKLPSLLINSNRSRCLRSVTHPKPKKSINTINIKEKQIPTIIISDSDDETDTIKISSNESTNLTNPNVTKKSVYKDSEISSSIVISDSEEEIETFGCETLPTVGLPSKMSEKLKLTCNLISTKPFITKKDTLTSDNSSTYINILDSDEETEAPSSKLLSKIREPVQISKKSNLTTNLTNVRTLLSKSVTKLRDSEKNDSKSSVVMELNKYKQNDCKIIINDKIVEQKKGSKKEKLKKDKLKKCHKTVRKVDQHSVNNRKIPESAISTNIFNSPAEIEFIVCRPKKINKRIQTNNSKPITVAIIENIQTKMATCRKSLNLESQCDKPLKMVASMNNKTETEDFNFVMAVIKKLTKTAVSVTRRMPMSYVQKQDSLIVLSRTPIKAFIRKLITKNPSNKCHFSPIFKSTKNIKKNTDANQILRKRRRLIRNVTIDISGPAVPKFCDHGFPDGTIEKAVHGRFISTIMAMEAANLIASHVPPRRPRMPIECALAKRYGYVPTLSDVDDDNSDKSDSKDNKVTTSTNTPVLLSTIMDIIEKAERASVETRCSFVHIWSNSARTSGSLLVSAIKLAKERVASLHAECMSQIETTTPFVSLLRQSRTDVAIAENFVLDPELMVTRSPYKRSVSATTSTNSNNCNRSEASKRSASVAFMETPVVLLEAENQTSKPSVTIVDTGEKEKEISSRSFKRSAEVAFSPESLLSLKNMAKSITTNDAADSSTKLKSVISPPELRKSKRSKSISVSKATPPMVKPPKRSKSTSLTKVASTVTDSLSQAVILPNSIIKGTKRSIPVSVTTSTSSICSSTSEEPISPQPVKHPKRSKSAVTSTTVPKSTSPLIEHVIKPSKRSKSAGSAKTVSAKTTTDTNHVTLTATDTLKYDMTPKVSEAENLFAPSINALDQGKIADVDVTTEDCAVAKVTEITEDETRIVTVTRTRCPIVPASVDVTADACTLVASACEQFVRTMVLERLTKAGRGFGTMELRRRDAFAAAMAFNENIRPTPEYCLTSTLAVTTSELSDSATVDLSKSNWPGYKLLHPPVTSSDDVSEQAIPAIVFDDELNTPTVLTVDTVVETQTTTTTTTTITPVNNQHSTTTVYTVKPISSSMVAPMSKNSARTRGVVVFKTTVPKTKTAADGDAISEAVATPQTGDEHMTADPTSSVPGTAETTVVFPDSTTEVVINSRTLPITMSNRPTATVDKHQTPEANRGFYVERGRPLLRPAFHRRRPFGTLVATSVMAALETTAENNAARKCVNPEEEKEVEEEEEEGERSDDEDPRGPSFGGDAGKEWGCYFGDSGCLPPVSRLSLFMANQTVEPKIPAVVTCPRVSSTSGDGDDPSLARQRKRLIEEIVRRQRYRERLTCEVERRLLEQRDRPRNTQKEHYQKFLRLQYGSKDATPGPPKMLRRPLNGEQAHRSIVSWY